MLKTKKRGFKIICLILVGVMVVTMTQAAWAIDNVIVSSPKESGCCTVIPDFVGKIFGGCMREEFGLSEELIPVDDIVIPDFVGKIFGGCTHGEFGLSEELLPVDDIVITPNLIGGRCFLGHWFTRTEMIEVINCRRLGHSNCSMACVELRVCTNCNIVVSQRVICTHNFCGRC